MPLKQTLKRLLRPFNLVMPVAAYGSKFKVPLMRGVGASHRQGSEAWMVDALQRLFKLSGQAGLIDVGVNIGQTLLKAKSIDTGCRYVGFEPNPFCIQFVNELIELNHFERCQLLPVALSDKPGLVDFMAESDADSAASMVSDLRTGKKPVRKQFIPTLVFDEIASQLDVNGISVVKIDVEGAELEVLLGMNEFLRRCRPLVTCEVLHAHSAAQLDLMRGRNLNLMALLDRSTYKAFRIRKNSGQTATAGLEVMTSFPDDVFNFRTSPAVCDYLFVPQERANEVFAAFEAGLPVTAAQKGMLPHAA